MKVKRVVTALYDYKANTTEELTFKAGDLFHVLDMQDSDWWDVRTTTGQTGLVASNYVEEVCLSLFFPFFVQFSNSFLILFFSFFFLLNWKFRHQAPVKAKVTAKWDCPAKIDEEVSIVVDEVLELLDDSDEDWWLVRKSSGETGLAPAIYLEIQPESHNIFEAEEVKGEKSPFLFFFFLFSPSRFSLN